MSAAAGAYRAFLDSLQVGDPVLCLVTRHSVFEVQSVIERTDELIELTPHEDGRERRYDASTGRSTTPGSGMVLLPTDFASVAQPEVAVGRTGTLA